MPARTNPLPVSKLKSVWNLRLLVHLFDELWQTAERSHAAQPATVFEGRRPTDHAPRRYIPGYPGLRGNHHPVADEAVADHPHLSRKHNVFPYARGTRESHLGAKQRIFSDPRSVADLNQVVDLDPARNLGVADAC